MSKNRDPDLTSTEYQVGYGKPPVHSRFKPGQSGNKSGRPRKGSDLLEEIQNRVLFDKRSVTIGGKKTRKSPFEIMLMKQMELALKGDTRAIKEISLLGAKLLTRHERIPLSVEEMSTRELLILRDNIIRREREKATT